jgi:hypothetical protein
LIETMEMPVLDEIGNWVYIYYMLYLK